MYADEIQDSNSLHRWQVKIDSDFHRKSLSAAYRATSRIFPLVVAPRRNSFSIENEQLLAFRSLLNSGVVAALGNNKLVEACYSASSAINQRLGLFPSAAAAVALTKTALAAADPASAFDTPVSAAVEALEGFGNADVEEFWSEVRFDALLIDSGGGALLRPLWSSTPPEWFGSQNSIAQSSWKTREPEIWSFWLRWWDGVLSGNQLDWDLQKEVALIPDAIWQQGPAAVAQEIAAIEEQYLLRVTFNAERIVENPETGLLRLEPKSLLSSGNLRDVQDKMRDAADSFDEAGGANGPYAILTTEIEMLRRASDLADPRPIHLYDTSRRALRRTLGKVKEGFCPDDTLVQDFAIQLEELSSDLRLFNEDVQTAVSARATAKLKDAGPEARQVFQDAAEAIAAVAEGDLAKDLPDDALVATDPKADPELRRAALFRFASRMVRIDLGAKKALGKLKSVHESGKKLARRTADETKDYADLSKNAGTIGGAIGLVILLLRALF
jgi:hypothetical protein